MTKMYERCPRCNHFLEPDGTCAMCPHISDEFLGKYIKIYYNTNNNEASMFNKLFNFCENLTHFKCVVQSIESLLDNFTSEYIKDDNAKDAAIDAVIEILQAHKSKKA